MLTGFRVSVREDGVGLILTHHECGGILLFTQNVSVDTLDEICEVHDAECGIPTKCAVCGKDPAPGFATRSVGNKVERFCHPDEGPSCYAGGLA